MPYTSTLCVNKTQKLQGPADPQNPEFLPVQMAGRLRICHGRTVNWSHGEGKKAGKKSRAKEGLVGTD